MAYMAARIGTISGTFLVPGVSRNGRWYRPEVVKAAVENMRDRIAKGSVPINLFTSHGTVADDNALAIGGKVSEVWVDEMGRARFRADIPNTSTGKDALALFDGKYARGVSIDGDWDNVQKVTGPNGGQVEAGENLQIRHLAMTGRPGVLDAGVEESVVEAFSTPPTRTSVRESYDGLDLDTVAVTEIAPPTPQAASTASTTTGTAEAAPHKETDVATKPEATETPVEESKPAFAELSPESVKALAESFAASIAAALKPAPVTEAVAETSKAPEPLTESAVRDIFAKDFDTFKDEVRDLLKSAGGLRRGIAARTTESEEPSKPLHEMSAAELRDYTAKSEAIPFFSRG